MLPAPRDSRPAAGLAVVLLLAWVAYFVAPGLAPGRTLLATDLLGRFPPWSASRPPGWEASNSLLFDQAMQFFPWRTLTGALARAGLPPLWNPFAGAGSPLLANYQSAPYAPLQAAVSALPWDRAPSVAAGLRLAVAALGMLALLGALGAGTLAALFGALAFVGSGSLALLLYHPNSDVSCWLPLVAYLALRLARRGEVAVGAFLALALGAQYLGGHPETSIYVVLVSVLAFALGRATPGPAGEARPRLAEALAALAAAELLGALLAAVQILPFLEYLGESDVLGVRQITRFANAPAAAVGLVAPGLFGTPLRPYTHFGPGNYHDVAMQYAGLATFVLALAGVLLWAARRRAASAAPAPSAAAPGHAAPAPAPRRPADVWIPALAVVAAVALLLAYPTPLWRLAETAGALRFTLNVTGLTLLYAFAIAVLGGLAVEELAGAARAGEEPRFARRAIGVLVIALAACAAVALVAGLALPLARRPLLGYGERLIRARYVPGLASQPIEYYLARLGAVLAAVRHALLATGALGVGVAVLLALRRRLPGALFALAALVLLAADLAHFGRGYLPAIDVGDALPTSRTVAELQAEGDVRVLPTGRALPPNSLTLWGVEDVRLSDAVGTAALDQYLTPTTPVPPLRRRFADYRRPLVDAAGVDVVASEDPLADPGLAPLGDPADSGQEGIHLYRNRRAWPRAFVVQREEGAVDLEAAVARTIAVARASAGAAPATAAARPGSKSVSPSAPGPELPERVVLSQARVGEGVAPDPLWDVVERLYPGLRAQPREQPGSARPDSTTPAWLGNPAYSSRRLTTSEPAYRRQRGVVRTIGRLTRGPLVVAARVEMAAPGWLVVLDQDFPGWEVQVDGRTAEGLCAYGLFRAVALERGRHVVTWSYRPETFALGVCMSLIALAATLLWLLLAPLVPRAGRAAAPSR